jgi:hypothetical protein
MTQDSMGHANCLLIVDGTTGSIDASFAPGI